MGFLPIYKKEMQSLLWDQCDFIMVTGDAYVDHPSFAMAVISRVLEHNGFKVGIIPQPNIKNTEDIKRLGKPKYGFLVSSGNLDSMVNNYSVTKNKRKEDAYSEGGLAGKRPDYAVNVYCKLIRQEYGDDMPIIIGGIEASLRRFCEYDYWSDTVKPSILIESKADLIIYGMGEKQIVQIANSLKAGEDYKQKLGCCFYTEDLSEVGACLILPSYEEVSKYPTRFNNAFKIRYKEQNSPNSLPIVQPHGIGYVVQLPPPKPMTVEEMDAVYDLPYNRKPHPSYKQNIPATEEVEFSITAHRGCYGGCAFCSLIFHQGRIIQKRSQESILKEGEIIANSPDFKGYIHDVGGPTANFHEPACKRQECGDVCKDRQCMFPTPCKNLKVDHKEWCDVLEKLGKIKKVKKVFVRSGIRFDYLLLEKDKRVLESLVENNISGQLKIAPEHISNNALKYMGKPCKEQYQQFCNMYERANRKVGMDQYIVPYFMSSHPGCNLNDAIELAQYLKEHNIRPKQVQDFYPTPGTLATCIYYTGVNPITNEKVFVAKTGEEKAMQRALMQYFLPQNQNLVRKALLIAKRRDLIGFDKKCLVREEKNSFESNSYGKSSQGYYGKSKKESGKSRR